MSIHGRYILLAFLFLLMSILYYPAFRDSVISYVRRVYRVRKRNVTPLLKGKKNFWFYCLLGETYDIKEIRLVNSAFLCSLFVYLLLIIPVFFLKWFAFVHYLSAVVHFILHARMIWFSSGENNMKKHGARRVLIAREKNGGINTVLFELFYIGLCAAAVWILGDFMMGVVFEGLKLGLFR